MTRQSPEPPSRVLIVKPSALGDVVTAMPVLRGLRRTFGPEVHVAWLISTTCADLISHDSDLDQCVLFERRRLGRAWRSVSSAGALARLVKQLKRGRYDWVIDLQGLLRSALLARATRAPVRAGFGDAREGAAWFYTHRYGADSEMHTVDRNIALARELGIDARSEDMTLQVAPAAGEWARAFAADHGLDNGFVVCVPPTRWSTKLYPVRHWRTVVGHLVHSVPVVLIGAPGDRELCAAVADGLGDRVIDVSGQTTVAQMVGLIASSSGVICCDSAAKFIAPALGVDVVTLIGPTRVARTGPYLRGRAVVSAVACQGCLQRLCSHITCMESIEPAAVIAAAEQMLEKKGSGPFSPRRVQSIGWYPGRRKGT